MTTEKKELLEKTYDRFVSDCMHSNNLDALDEIVHPQIMGFGTAINEKVFSLLDLKALLQRQKEQSEGLHVEWEFQPCNRFVSADENSAVFADDLILKVAMPEGNVEMYLRFTTVYEYKSGKWIAVHFHGSKPEGVLSEVDTFGVETWKQKAGELEIVVAERTAMLSEKLRELEIEASLERIRSTAMSMQQPDDLLKISEILFKELQAVGFKNLRNALIHTFNDEEKYFTDYDYSEFTGGCISRIPYSGHPAIDKFIREIRGSKDAFTEITIIDQELEDWRAFRKSNREAPDARLDEASALYYYFYSVGPADIGISTFTSISVQDLALLKRYRNVFDLAYRRYLDIEHALAQARKAQIEGALEKVRSRSLAMHKSEELNEVVAIVFEKLKELHIPATAVGISLSIEGSKDLNAFVCGAHGAELVITNYRLPFFEHVISNDLIKALAAEVDLFVGTYSKEEKDSFYDYLFEHTAISQLPGEIKRMILQSKTYTLSMVAVKHALFNINDFEGKNLTAYEVDVIRRFATVFDQAYRRFLDLQHAEMQAKEAQIEAALERVRSRSLGMHHTSEIQRVIHTVHEELIKLKLSVYGGSFIVINADVDDELFVWGSGATADTATRTRVPHFDMPFCTNLIQGIKRGPAFFVEAFSRDEKLAYFTELFQHEPWSEITDDAKENVLQSEGGYTRSVSVLRNTSVFVVNQNGRIFTETENDILGRVSKVFEQAYTRFLDLKKAEAQAREAQVELSLERIRARVTAMHRSTDLLDIVVTMRKEFVSLGHEAHYFWHMRWQPDMYEKAMTSGDGSRIGMVMELPRGFHNNPSMTAWESNAEPCAVFAFDVERAIDYVDRMVTTARFSEIDPTAPGPDAIRSIGGLTFVMARTTHGEIGYSLPGVVPHPPAEDLATLVRFAGVFDLAYRRFEDLQSSEKRIRGGQIDLAIERVRARTLAMQKSEELTDTGAVMFRQLIHLGIEPHRLYIAILKNNEGEAEFWITDQDGSKMSTTHAENLHTNPTFRKMLNGWQQEQKSLVIDIEGAELETYLRYLDSINVPLENALDQKRRLQYIAYFGRGFIGMASPEEQPAETLQLLERFADVFKLTFTRFNDLQVAEAHAQQAAQDLIRIKVARKKAEEALIDLRATQKQLVQSEKMASLGELTAGIAHEIQNPLNFVNNFSEVSKELLDEMELALENGNDKEAREIVADIKENLEKIHHHGKRADAIVKGMLQHSRASSNQREATDINALADEYLRLAYHGLRAKDKSFNATLKTDYDQAIGNIQIIPQDLGRVILNLITNAFYAVTEKRNGSIENYEPTVSVRTERSESTVRIIVNDNGNGIPTEIINKIFQPFFTTKPTGQGTGLGLSMSYDIVKNGHDGDLRVETGAEGTSFIIELPVKSKE